MDDYHSHTQSFHMHQPPRGLQVLFKLGKLHYYNKMAHRPRKLTSDTRIKLTYCLSSALMVKA